MIDWGQIHTARVAVAKELDFCWKEAKKGGGGKKQFNIAWQESGLPLQEFCHLPLYKLKSLFRYAAYAASLPTNYPGYKPRHILIVPHDPEADESFAYGGEEFDEFEYPCDCGMLSYEIRQRNGFCDCWLGKGD